MADPESMLDREVGGVFFGHFAGLLPHQQAAIGHLLEGRDIVLSAGTGSGKTEAVVAPLVSRFRVEAVTEEKPFLLYICPTKALINDLARRLKEPLERLGLRLAIRHGDRNDLKAKAPAHVILTTPESLGILVMERHPALRSIRAAVVDEVHLLYNNQRGAMVAILLHRLKRMTDQPLQVAVLSATMGRLADLRRFILGDDSKAELLSFPSGRTIDAQILGPAPPAQFRGLMVKLMDDPKRKLLVFCDSRRASEDVSALLTEAPELRDVTFTHHSSLSRESRERVEASFAALPRAVCVATSTLEMGIDIGDIDAVVLYGCPQSIESLLQRIGRGSRRSERTAAICFCPPDAPALREITLLSCQLQTAAAGRMPDQAPVDLYGALVQQIGHIVLQNKGGFVRTADFCEQICHRPDINRALVQSVLDEVSGCDFLKHHGFRNSYGAGQILWRLEEQDLVWGNFPESSQLIDLTCNGRSLGSIPRENLLRLVPGTTLGFGGKRYRVVNVPPREIRLEPAGGGGGSDVKLTFAHLGPRDLGACAADALWQWLFTAGPENSFADTGAWQLVVNMLEGVRQSLTPRSLPVCREPGGWRYYTFAGMVVNRVLCEWIAPAAGRADDLSILTESEIHWTAVPVTAAALGDEAERCFAPSSRQTIFQRMLPVELQRAEWRNEWLADRDAERVLRRLKASCPVEVGSSLLKDLRVAGRQRPQPPGR